MRTTKNSSQADSSGQADGPIIGLYVLTIESPDGARYQHANEQAHRIANEHGRTDVTMLEGVHAAKTDVTPHYDSDANRRHMKYPLSGPEIACYLSHRQAWKQFLESALPYALILEDDFVIRDQTILSNVLQEVPDFDFRWDVIKLHDFTERTAWRSRAYNGFVVSQANSPAACATAYIVTRVGAHKLLRGGRPVYRPVDHDFKYYWETKVRIFTVLPNPIGEMGEELGGSALEGSRRTLKARRSLLDDLRGTRLTVNRTILNLVYRKIYSLDPPRD